MSAGWNMEELAFAHAPPALAVRARRFDGDSIYGDHWAVARTVVLVMAGVHGDEYEGPAAVHDVSAEIDPNAVQGSILLVPVANPWAFHAAARRHPGDGGDLNRAFPGNSAEGRLNAWRIR